MENKENLIINKTTERLKCIMRIAFKKNNF